MLSESELQEAMSALSWHYPVTLQQNVERDLLEVILNVNGETMMYLPMDKVPTLESFEKKLGYVTKKVFQPFNTSPDALIFRRAVFGTTTQWTHFIPENKILSTLYICQEQYNDTQDRMVLSLLSQTYNFFFSEHVYMKKTRGRFQMCKESEHGIRKMLRPETPDIEIKYNPSLDILVDDQAKVITLPRSHYGVWAKTAILQHNSKIFQAVLYMAENLGSKDVKHTCVQIDVKWDGKFTLHKTDMEIPEWQLCIKHETDKEWNPNNTPAHIYLGDSKQPRYVDSEYYVTHAGTVYVYFNKAWLRLSETVDRMKERKSHLSEEICSWLDRYDLALRLQGK